MNAFQNRLQKLSPISIYSRRCHGWPSRSGVRRNPTYELILLDVLQSFDGISLCQQLRSHGHRMPLLTARDTTADQVTGLDAGADDYVVKPISRRVNSAHSRFTAPRKFFALRFWWEACA